MSVATTQICRTVEEVRDHVARARERGLTVGLVPTMGALHEGHRQLIERAHQGTGFVVVSVFVNPTQFGDSADLEAYPRTLDADSELASSAGADLIFAPDVAELYPADFKTEVRLSGPLTESLEGAHRGAAHFHGVTTVVTMLLNICTPDVAYFGAKDAQQVRVIERLVRDLRVATEIVRVPTVRDDDGLALSSRNIRLSDEARAQALGLSRALHAARDAYAAGARDRSGILGPAEQVLAGHALEPEYLELCSNETLEPLDAVTASGTLVVAVTVGGVRLIDTIDLP